LGLRRAFLAALLCDDAERLTGAVVLCGAVALVLTILAALPID
jgi:hypothetical protein